MLHDDGQHTDDLEHADVVLTGVSRTSKTPTSIYLANRGVKTANVPLVPNMPVPPQLERLTAPLVVGLYASPERIVQIRQNRLLGLERASRRRSLCRPPGGGRGDRVLAQALRQAQLADHRRDAPLDRGNGGRRDGAACRPAPPAGAFVMRCALAVPQKPLVLASQSKVRRALLEAAGIPVEARPAHLDERAIEQRVQGGPARGRADAGAREGAHGRGHVGPRASWLAATRPWRSGERRFSKPADRAGARARSSWRCAARPTSCIPPSWYVGTEP